VLERLGPICRLKPIRQMGSNLQIGRYIGPLCNYIV
jgi:hypothetical protein